MSGFNDQTASDNPEIFFRAADRLQIESYLTALRQDNKSLILLSKHKALLSYYGELVVQRIYRAFPQTSLEVLLPADTEGLLERFNAILNSLSFEVATRPNPKGMPDKIWLIQDAKALGEKDIQILLKLIENFPGAGICAVLMFDSSETEVLSVFENNPKINTWYLSLPTPEQKLNAIQQARRNGTEEIAVGFFNQLAKSEKNASALGASKPAALNADDQSSKKSEQVQKSSNANHLEAPNDGKTSSSPKKKILPWVIIFSGLLSISVAVSAVLHPEFGEKILNLFTYKNKNIKAVSSEDLSSAIKENSSAASTEEMNEVALQGQRWLMKLPEDHFVLEFQTFTSVQEAQKEIENNEWLKRTHVVPVRVDGSNQMRYLLVDGPFRTAEIAKKAASRMPNSSDIVIENVGSLRGYATPQKTQP